MIRNLKVLGLALVAVFAMSAMAASAASAANGLLTSDGPVKLDGTEEASPAVNALTAFGLVTKCPGSTYVGEKVNSSELIPSGSSEATITPTYVNCETAGGPTTVTMNGCDYVLHLSETSGVADTYKVIADVVCPKEKDILIDVYATKAKHETNEPFCQITIKPQTGKTGATLKDLTNGELTLGGTVEGVSAEKITGGVLCAKEATATAKLDLAVTIKGTNSTGGATTVSLSHL
jgi:hypothetical protein